MIYPNLKPKQPSTYQNISQKRQLKGLKNYNQRKGGGNKCVIEILRHLIAIDCSSQIATSNGALDVSVSAPRGNKVQNIWEINKKHYNTYINRYQPFFLDALASLKTMLDIK